MRICEGLQNGNVVRAVILFVFLLAFPARWQSQATTSSTTQSGSNLPGYAEAQSDMSAAEYAAPSDLKADQISPAAVELMKTARFDIAAIHPVQNVDPRRLKTIFLHDARGNFSASNVTLQFLVSLAWNTRSARILGGPSWFATDYFSLNARSDDELGNRLFSLPEPERRLIRQQMLKALLEERFGVRVKVESRVLPVLLLETAKRGAQLKSAEEITEKQAQLGPERLRNFASAGNYHYQNSSVSLEQLAVQLSHATHEIVVDRTGIEGSYAVNLTWAKDDAFARADAEAADGRLSSAPSLFAALDEQLGLKLIPGKATVDVLVIERAQKPSDN